MFEAHSEIYRNYEFHMVHFKVSTIVLVGDMVAVQLKSVIGDFSFTVLRRPMWPAEMLDLFSFFFKNTKLVS